jgi:hypothetical protein
MELQEQLGVYNRDLRGVRSALSSAQRDQRMNAVTSSQIETLAPSVSLYRSVGKVRTIHICVRVYYFCCMCICT